MADSGRLVKGRTVNRMSSVFYGLGPLIPSSARKEGMNRLPHLPPRRIPLRKTPYQKNTYHSTSLKFIKFSRICRTMTSNKTARTPEELMVLWKWLGQSHQVYVLLKLTGVPDEQNLSEPMPSHQPDYFHPSRAS